MTEVFCSNCGIKYEKPDSEVKRNIEKGRNNFCSKKCLGKINAGNLPPKEKRTWDHLRKGSEKDQYSGFREFIRRVKNRKHDYDIDLEFLLELWNKQEGKCAYTNIPMVLPDGKKKGTMFTASLDRIDSSKGYIKENVQYTLTHINLMKSNMTHENAIEFIRIIKNS